MNQLVHKKNQKHKRHELCQDVCHYQRVDGTNRHLGQWRGMKLKFSLKNTNVYKKAAGEKKNHFWDGPVDPGLVR